MVTSTFLIVGSITYLPWFLTTLAYSFSNTYTPNINQLFDIERTINDLKIILDYVIAMPYLFSIFWMIFSIILILNIKSMIKGENFILFLYIVFHFLLYWDIHNNPIQSYVALKNFF